jgi:flagellar motor switch protein FliN
MAEQDTMDLEETDIDDTGESERPVAARLESFDEDGDQDDDDDSGVAEALRAWAAGGHSAEEESTGDEILPVQFAQLEEPPPRPIKPRYARINNVFVDITVELGRREMSVRELTEMKVQDVIDLDKLAGEAFDILINKRPFAEGEIVVVTDLMAVRITRLIDRTPPEEEEE